MSNAKQGQHIRLHKYVTKQTGLNKAQAIELILAGKVRVDGKVVLDSKAQVSSKAMLQVELPPLNRLIKGFDLTASGLQQLPVVPAASQPSYPSLQSYQIVPVPMGAQANPNYAQSMQDIIAAASAAGAASAVSAIAAAFPFLANAAGTQGDAAAQSDLSGAAAEQGNKQPQEEFENMGRANINHAASSMAAANKEQDDSQAEVSQCTDLVKAPDLTPAPAPAPSSSPAVAPVRAARCPIPANDPYWRTFDEPDYDPADDYCDCGYGDDDEYDDPYLEERYQENCEEVWACMSTEDRDIFSVDEYADLMGYDLYH